MAKQTAQERRAWLQEHGFWNWFKERREQIIVEQTVSRYQAGKLAMEEIQAGKAGDTMKHSGVPRPHRTLSVSKEKAQDVPVLNKDAVSKDDFAGKAEPSIREVAEWVFDNIDMKDVQASDAPSAGAWSLLRWVQKNKASNQSEFYRTFSAKLLPSRQQLEVEGRFVDDGRKLDGYIERCIAAGGVSSDDGGNGTGSDDTSGEPRKASW